MGNEVPLYASAYAGLDVRERVRRETYGEDLGQSSWMTVDELDRFGELLELHAGSRLLDVGCGSGGPVLHLARATGATVVGVDVLEEGIAAATAQAREHGLEDQSTFVRADAGERLPFEDESFDAILSIDAMCHLPDRLSVLEEWRRVIGPGGRILFTDPTIVTGPVTGAEIADRSAIGVYVFSIASLNEELVAEAGFDLLRREDVTESTATVARRWADARQRFADELIADEGAATFEGVQRFLGACHVLAHERRLSRYAYLALPRSVA
jgi:ubiquinone/menaquinone biosynthesis C-methylase UbiE